MPVEIVVKEPRTPPRTERDTPPSEPTHTWATPPSVTSHTMRWTSACTSDPFQVASLGLAVGGDGVVRGEGPGRPRPG